MALRTLLLRAAQIEAGAGLHPDLVRSAVRMHQTARPAAYLLARRTLASDYLAVADIPYPAGLTQPLPAGAVLLARDGRRFDDDVAAPEQRRAG